VRPSAELERGGRGPLRGRVPPLQPGRRRLDERLPLVRPGRHRARPDPPRRLPRVRRVLLVSRIRDWGYRVLLRPGISGVDPRWPKAVEIEQRYVVGTKRRDEIPGTMLVGLLTHELGPSFLY